MAATKCRARSLQRPLAGGLVVLLSVALGACGGSAATGGAGASNSSVAGAGEVVDIYSSLPMRGPAAPETTAAVNGIRLALAQADDRAGRFAVRYIALDDSSGADGWDATQTAADAHQAAADTRAVYYIGEFDDAASEISMPILNEAGIPQVSPANTYVGLTFRAPGTAANEPRGYVPTGIRTYLRIVPVDSVQSAALLLAMKESGCARVALIDDGEPYGAALAASIEVEKRAYGIDVVSDTGVDSASSPLHADAARSGAARPDCVLLAGVASKHAVLLTSMVHAALPAAKIFAPGGMCTSAWTNPRDGGVPPAIDPLIECTAVTRKLTAYPGGRAFLAAYAGRYGAVDPNPYAILGYEAMKLGLSTVASLGANGDSKSAVLRGLFATTDRHSVLGTYGFDRNGDTTLRSYGLYKVGRSGDPAFVRTITPGPAL